MHTKILNLFLFSITMLCMISCGSDDKSVNAEGDTIPAEGSSVICLWSSLTIKASPEQNGKYVTAIYLGETSTFLGETVVDSSNKKKPREFIKLKLKDGTTGWDQANLLAINAKPYAVKNTTKLYKRPDILASSKDQFELMQFVVVTEEQDGWVKVKGKKRADSWFNEGWVKIENLTNTEADITVAILAERALSKETPEKKTEALNEIIDNPDLSTSIFISDVRTLKDELSGSDAQLSAPEGEVENEVEGE